MPNIENNITLVTARVNQAAIAAGRSPDEILLLAVSKTRSAEDIRSAINAGIREFGENYLQEAVEKIAQLAAENLQWHSVDRLKIAQRLSEQRPSGLPPLNICLQVNIDNEASKSGFATEETEAAALAIVQLPGLKLRGLMAIPRAEPTYDQQIVAFRALADLRDRINQSLDNSEKLDTLSMGMSSDLEAAISQGSTIVRVGTDIFGKRT
jgi:PLP dependent protein